MPTGDPGNCLSLRGRHSRLRYSLSVCCQHNHSCTTPPASFLSVFFGLYFSPLHIFEGACFCVGGGEPRARRRETCFGSLNNYKSVESGAAWCSPLISRLSSRLNVECPPTPPHHSAQQSTEQHSTALHRTVPRGTV